MRKLTGHKTGVADCQRLKPTRATGICIRHSIFRRIRPELAFLRQLKLHASKRTGSTGLTVRMMDSSTISARMPEHLGSDGELEREKLSHYVAEPTAKALAKARSSLGGKCR